MSTIAAPATMSGLNGFDFTQLINVTIQSESGPMTALQTKQANLQNKDSVLAALGTQVAQLEATVTSLGSQTAFTNVSASSADSSIATATLGTGGIAGEYTVNVAHLAKAQLAASTNGYADATKIAADGGSISFTIGTDTTTPILISSETTLTDLANQINSQNSGVSASIVNDGTNYKLAIMSRQTGVSNAFTINNSLTNSVGTAVAFAVGQSPTTGNSQDALDASFTVNGLQISSASNTPESAIPGATLKLTKAGETTINVTADYSGLQATLNTLVSQYNSLQQFATQQSGKGGPLAGDPVSQQVMKDIRGGIMAATSNSGQYQYLAEIGLQFTATGTLSLDQKSFDAALNSSPQDLQKLFQGTTGSDGVFHNLLDELKNDDATSGMIATNHTSAMAAIKNYTSQIASQQMRMDNRRLQLTKLYSAADQAMTKMRAAAQPLSQLGTSSLLGSIGQ